MMKRLLKVLKIIFLGVLALIGVVIIGLLFFYQSIYKEMAPPPETTAFNLNFSPPSDEPVLLPVPKSLQWNKGLFIISANIRFQAPKENVELIQKILSNRLNIKAVLGKSGSFLFIKNKSLAAQGYTLSVGPTQIKIA